MTTLPAHIGAGEPYSPQVRVFDLALVASALPACIREVVDREPGPNPVGLYMPFARMARAAVAGIEGVKITRLDQKGPLRPTARGLLRALGAVDRWLNTARHSKYVEDRETYITEARGFEPDEFPREEELCRFLAKVTPYGAAARRCNALAKTLTGVFTKYSPACRLGKLVGDIWAFDSAEAGGAPDPQRLDAFRQIDALIYRWPDKVRVYPLHVFTEPRVWGSGPDHFYSAIQEIRRGLAAQSSLGAPDKPRPSAPKKRAKPGETPTWLVSALTLLQDSNGMITDAQIAREVGVNRSTLSRHPAWKKAKRTFSKVRVSDVGERVRASARAARTTPEALLRNELRNNKE